MSDSVSQPFDAEFLEHVFEVDAANNSIALQSHRMVFNPTGFGLTLAPLVAARIESDTRVCEVGIGSGVLCIMAGMAGAHVTGLDINPHAVHMARRNWRRNNLPEAGARFMESSVFSALDKSEQGSFDTVWSNPPLLPLIGEAPLEIHNREGFEIAGENGRRVLDGVLGQAHHWLRPGGRVVTIATSLQGWGLTERLLEKNWQRYTLLEEVELELTEECGPPFIEWWLEQERQDGEVRVYQQAGKWMHKLWFLEAFA